MSELKYQLMLNKDMSWVPCYLKSEADKAIAELEESHKMEVEQLLLEIVELKKEIEKQKRLRDMALASVPNVLKVMKIIQYNKYKRCLAMVQVLEHVCPMTNRKAKWRDKWHKRWLAIAEKFKPNNSTAQHGKEEVK